MRAFVTLEGKVMCLDDGRKTFSRVERGFGKALGWWQKPFWIDMTCLPEEVWLYRLKRNSLWLKHSDFSIQGNFVLQGTLAMSGYILVVTHLTMHRTAPSIKNYLPQMSLVPRLRSSSLITEKRTLELWVSGWKPRSSPPPLETPANGPGKSNELKY